MNFCVIGTNFISDDFCNAAAAAGAFVYGVLSRERERGLAFAEKHGIPMVYTDINEMLYDNNIQAVYIASPNIFHYPYAIAAMRAKKNVLCEKPMGISLEEIIKMSECAKECGVILLEAMRPAHDPSTGTIKESIARLGKISEAKFSFCQYSRRYDKFLAGEYTNTFNPELGNSALLDLGVYGIYFTLELFGMPRDVRRVGTKISGGFEAEGLLTLEYADKTVLIEYSKIRAGDEPSYILGDGGRITIDKLNQPKRIEYHCKDSKIEVISLPEPQNNMIFEIQAFMEMCKAGRGNEEYLELSLCAAKIMDWSL